MELVQSAERRVPLYHEYREEYLIDVVRDLFHKGEHPAIVFIFGRELCFETARLLKSCRRFTTDEEREEIARRCDAVLLDRGIARDLRPLLLHGIGIHHAGLLPRYKRLVEELVLDRLLKFVVSTETISAGINLPAKRVVFPSLRKVIKGTPRLLTSAEYHQMAGRAGRPQFDTEGLAITLAPEEVTQEIKKETKEAQKGRLAVDLAKIRRSAYGRARADAARNQTVVWDDEVHKKLVEGRAAPLRSQTQITADQILAIGLPDLACLAPVPGCPVPGCQAPDAAAAPEPAATCLAPPGAPPGERTPSKDEAVPAEMDPSIEAVPLPASMNLHVYTVIDHLLMEPRARAETRRRLEHYVENLVALGIVDEHGQQKSGEIIRELRGVDGPFVHHCLMNHDLGYEGVRQLVEFLVDHDTIHNILARRGDDKKREWMRNRLRERRADEPQVSWQDVEVEYEQRFPRELSLVELIHQEFTGRVPHPELHGGKVQKKIWADMEETGDGFMDFIERYDLATEEGNLFSYLARVMRTAKMLFATTGLAECQALEERVREKLAVIDPRVVAEIAKER
jgi:hypothetical protein